MSNTIKHIVNIGENREIGKNGKLIFRISEDLKRFKKLTTGNIIITGRKNYEDMGELPNRTTIVVTRNKEYICPQGGNPLVANSIQKAIDIATGFQNKDIYIVGGAEIYQQTLKEVDKLEITQVLGSDPEADTFYPDFRSLGFNKCTHSKIKKDPKTDLRYRFETWKKGVPSVLEKIKMIINT